MLEKGVEVIMTDFTGPCTMWDRKRCFCYVLDHFEYESDTMDGQYRRDLKNGSPDGSTVQIPEFYYPGNDPEKPVVHSWLNNGIIFYNAWISEVQARKEMRSKM